MLDLTNNINENNHEIQFLATKWAKIKRDIEKQSFLLFSFVLLVIMQISTIFWRKI